MARSRPAVLVTLGAVLTLPLAGCGDVLEQAWEEYIFVAPDHLEYYVSWTLTPSSEDGSYDMAGSWAYAPGGIPYGVPPETWPHTGLLTGLAVKHPSPRPSEGTITVSGLLTDPEGNPVGTFDMDGRWAANGWTYFNGQWIYYEPAIFGDLTIQVDGLFDRTGYVTFYPALNPASLSSPDTAPDDAPR